MLDIAANSQPVSQELAEATGLLDPRLFLLIPVVVCLLLLRGWYVRRRRLAIETLVVRYEPPAGMRPALAGYIVHRDPDVRHILATLVDLSTRGYVKLEQHIHHAGGSAAAFRMRLLKTDAEWQELKYFEQRLLKQLYHGQSATKDAFAYSAELKQRLPEVLASTHLYLLQEAGHAGYLRDADVNSDPWIQAAIVAGFFSAGALIILLITGGSSMWKWLAFAIALTGAVLFAYAAAVQNRKDPDPRLLAQIMGFQEFLVRARSDYMDRIIQDPGMFDRFLPYAMALGVEERWSSGFAGMVEPAVSLEVQAAADYVVSELLILSLKGAFSLLLSGTKKDG